MGDRIAFADIWIAAYLRWIQLVMPERWEEVKLWHDGRWAMLLDSLETCKAIL
jgi:glutathione S-transferase